MHIEITMNNIANFDCNIIYQKIINYKNFKNVINASRLFFDFAIHVHNHMHCCELLHQKRETN